MDKKLKLSFISLMVLSCVMVAWLTLLAFFKGSAIGMVAMLLVMAFLTYNMVTDSYVRSRIKDLFILAIILTALELIVFMVVEYGWFNTAKVVLVFMRIQTILSIVGIVFFAYVVFRMVYENKSLRLGTVEKMLGNSVQSAKRVKQSKEFTNGSLEEKPNKQRKEGTFYNTVSSDTDQEGEE